MTLDMTFEAREKIFRKEEREEGIQEGLREGLKQGEARAYIHMFNKGLISAESAAEELGISVEEFKKLQIEPIC